MVKHTISSASTADINTKVRAAPCRRQRAAPQMASSNGSAPK